MLMNLGDHGTIMDGGEEDPEGKLTFNEILAQAFLFFAAGYETSSTAMSFALYFIAKHSDVQKKLREEIRSVKARHDGHITYEALMEMTYLNQVFNETMRIFPPVAMLIRMCNEDYTVEKTGQVIPKGTMVQIPVYAIHRDPEYFSNPEKFDPDRFTQAEIEKRHPYAFLAFGEGPRMCIGSRFAQLQARYGLAVTVENFEISVNPKTIEPIELDKANPNTGARGGIWIDFKTV